MTVYVALVKALEEILWAVSFPRVRCGLRGFGYGPVGWYNSSGEVTARPQNANYTVIGHFTCLSFILHALYGVSYNKLPKSLFFIANCCMFLAFYCNIFEQIEYLRVLYHLPAPPADRSLWKPSSPAVPYYATLSVRLLLISIRAFLMRKHWFSLVRVRG